MGTKPKNPSKIGRQMRKKFDQLKKRANDTLNPSEEQQLFNQTRNQLDRYKKVVLKVEDGKVDLDGAKAIKQADRLFGGIVDLFHGHLSEMKQEGRKSEGHIYRIAKQQRIVREKEKKLENNEDKTSQLRSKLDEENSVLKEMEKNSKATRQSTPLHEIWRQFKEKVSERVQRFKQFIQGTEVDFAPILTDNEKKLLENAGKAVLESLNAEVKDKITKIEVRIGALGEVEATAKYNDESGPEQQRKFVVEISRNGTYAVKENKSFTDRFNKEKQSREQSSGGIAPSQ